MRIGVTGHQRLDRHSDWSWAERTIAELLSDYKRLDSQLVGISSLAIGADTVFARQVLQLGGQLHVVIPFAGYGNDFDGPDRDAFQRLLKVATAVEVLMPVGSEEEAYLSAGKRVVGLADILVAVWDGKPAAGLGGTADVVAHARTIGRTVIHINPDLHHVGRLKP